MTDQLVIGLFGVLCGIWLGSKARARTRLYDAWSEGYTAASRHFVQMHEAMKAAKPDGDVHWIESGWYRFDVEPMFRSLDALAVDDYLAQDLRQSVPGEAHEINPNHHDILGDPEE